METMGISVRRRVPGVVGAGGPARRAGLARRRPRAAGRLIAKATWSVRSGMFGLATRHDVMPGNLIRDTAAPPSGPTKDRRALTLAEAWDLRAKIAADRQAVDWDLVDLVDLVDMMMATGLRIGEAAAVTWPSLDLEGGTVEVRGTVIRITGKGRDHQTQAQVESRLAGD